MKLLNIAVYKFMPLDDLLSLRPRVKEKCVSLELKGTILLAPEGINCFLAGREEKIREFQEFLSENLGRNDFDYKYSWTEKQPFVRMLVKIKKEIIPIGDPEIRPDQVTGQYISPKKLKRWLDEGREFVLLDTRNAYEVKVGTFEKAIHLNVQSFMEFSEQAKQLPDELKEKEVVMFCTGGIRCEKASALFMKQGFKNVHQLEGGILKYFEECQQNHYQGDCFVFDWRIAVDSNLAPVGDPASLSDEDFHLGRHQIKRANQNPKDTPD